MYYAHDALKIVNAQRVKIAIDQFRIDNGYSPAEDIADIAMTDDIARNARARLMSGKRYMES